MVSTEDPKCLAVALQELFEKEHLEMVQESVVHLHGLAVVDGVLPE